MNMAWFTSQTMPKPRLRRRLLRCLERALHWTGLGWAYVKVGRIRGAVILMYHSVVRPEDERWIDPRCSVRADVFDAQMKFLARHRNVIALGALLDALARGGTLPAGSVVITLDDGYKNNLEVAAPILLKHGLPAVLYLATGYVERGEAQWVDQLFTMFRERTRHALELDGLDGLDRATFDLISARATQTAYSFVERQLLSLDRSTRECLLRRVERQLRPAARPPRLTLTWDEVRKLARIHRGLDIGVHTVDHLDLTACDAGTARAEIERSITHVQRELGLRPVHFSFPYGRSSARTRTVVSNLGFRSAVASGTDFLITNGSDRFALPRIEPPLAMTLFRFRTSGAWPGLTRALVGRP